ncbi:MAG: hypothetical protein JRJ64_06885 [Deltaproteobacteria bacterium]|nr:hypothetical protein [Deltaproteobacteria bacterium]
MVDSHPERRGRALGACANERCRARANSRYRSRESRTLGRCVRGRVTWTDVAGHCHRPTLEQRNGIPPVRPPTHEQSDRALLRDFGRRKEPRAGRAGDCPSGDPEPSPQDLELTDRLVSAGSLLDIRILDHVIVGSGRYTSLRDAGLWPSTPVKSTRSVGSTG